MSEVGYRSLRNVAEYLVCTNAFADGTKHNPYIHCLQVAIATPEGGSQGYPFIKISPSPEKVAALPGSMSPKKNIIKKRLISNYPALLLEMSKFVIVQAPQIK